MTLLIGAIDQPSIYTSDQNEMPGFTQQEPNTKRFSIQAAISWFVDDFNRYWWNYIDLFVWFSNACSYGDKEQWELFLNT